MFAYLLRRTAVSFCLILAVCTILFMALHMVPGDPAELLLSTGGAAPSRESVLELREKMGLNRPLLTQYLDFLSSLSRGDLGRSFVDDEPVLGNIVLRLPRTLELVAAAGLIAIAAGIPLGTIGGIRPRGTLNSVLSGTSALALSVPVFVTGTILIFVLAQTLRVLPAGGYVPVSVSPSRHLASLLMPALTIAIGLWAVIFRMTRAAVIEAMSRDWVRTARAKGLAEYQVVVRHVVRNALGPVITVTGLQLGSLLGGTVLVEYVFNWPGLSGFLVKAVEQRDYPEVQGVVLVISVVFILLNLVTDLLYSALDPRVRRG